MIRLKATTDRGLLAAALCLGGMCTAAQAQVTGPAPEITFQQVEQPVLDTVADSLPEATAVDTSFLNPDYDPVLRLNADAHVSVTFIDEGAGYKNSLGYVSFTDGAFDGLSKGQIDIDGSGVISLTELGAVQGVDLGWVFPDSSEQNGGGSLLTGDTVELGDGAIFNAGTNISFFLGQNAWSGTLEGTAANIDNKQVMYGLDFLNPEANSTALFGDTPENARHVAMLFTDDSRDQVIMGFEDLNRADAGANDYGYRSDEDFNDAVFLVTSDPAGAFGDSNIATAPAPTLGSGLGGAMLLGLLAGVTTRGRGAHKCKAVRN